MSIITVAAAQYPIDAVANFSDYVDKVTHWTHDAVRHGAQLLVYPEYAAMELSALAGLAGARDVRFSARFVADLTERIERLHSDLAQRFYVHILASSHPHLFPDGRIRNRCRLYGPHGGVGTQTKLIMTRFEDEAWGISSGTEICVFDTVLGRIGVTICFDVEFPLIARAMAEQGAQIILAPSCTDSAAGAARVKVGAQARALENQCFVVTAPTVGQAPWSACVDENTGAAGVFCPPDLGFPANGIIAEGTRDMNQWLYAALDLRLVERVRNEGAVFNYNRWSNQPGAPVLEAKVVRVD